MIDKSVEHRDIVMVMDGRTAAAMPEPVLPEGFRFRFFNGEEDAAHWCRIEASVREFDSEADAKKHFEEEFGGHTDQLRERCIFIVNSENHPVATAMGWFSEDRLTNRLHWIAVCPEYQGLGLGKAVSQKAVTVCAGLSPDHERITWLSTQTGSHRAVAIYHKLGFNMTNKPIQSYEEKTYIKDFDRALEVLATVIKSDVMESIKNKAVI